VEVNRKATPGGGGSFEILRGRANPAEINRIQQDGNTQVRTAEQKGHKPTNADRLNAILAKLSPKHAEQVRSGVWGRLEEREVHPDLLSEDERRALEVADEGTKMREQVFVGQAPYSIQDLGDGRTVVRLDLEFGAVIVGVGTSVSEAITDLEKQVNR
jgi:hypothetical protein